ncbi:hypothetical protein LX69_01161 [Breznakibacter xylanolyticus]|uniref:Uncharacterized protein n=1 Tax=Breznakibacter xylanolyticus TaxID=990 RepID=A0A2W7NN93_9BACT|nr:hypothetical protein LX69_01161 [Breznakibacter xylanolyticus]
MELARILVLNKDKIPHSEEGLGFIVSCLKIRFGSFNYITMGVTKCLILSKNRVLTLTIEDNKTDTNLTKKE